MNKAWTIRHQGGVLFLAFLIVWVCVLLGSVNAASQKPPGIHQQTNTRSDNEREPTRIIAQNQPPKNARTTQNDDKDVPHLGFNLTTLTLAILLVYILIAHLTWWSTISTIRPHLIVKDVRIYKWVNSRDPRNPTDLNVSVLVVNYGNSPAWITRLNLDVRFHGSSDLKDQRPTYRNPSDNTGRLPVPRRRTLQFSWDPQITISKSDQILFVADQVNLFIYGFIEYRDIHHGFFHRRLHHSSFAFRYFPRQEVPDYYAVLNERFWKST